MKKKESSTKIEPSKQINECNDIDINVNQDVEDQNVNIKDPQAIEIENLRNNRSKNELIELCIKKKLKYFKSWSKSKLATCIVRSNGTNVKVNNKLTKYGRKLKRKIKNRKN